jgi:hypothetical protein
MFWGKMTAQQVSNFSIFEKMGIEKVVGEGDRIIFFCYFFLVF